MYRTTSAVSGWSRFKQVVYNYLSNAVKFPPDDGGISVRLRAEPTAVPPGSGRYRRRHLATKNYLSYSRSFLSCRTVAGPVRGPHRARDHASHRGSAGRVGGGP